MRQAEACAGAGELVRDVSEGSRPGLPTTLSGAEIRALRRSLGMTQERFAEEVGCASAVTVCQWESGKVRPSRPYREKMARIKR